MNSVKIDFDKTLRKPIFHVSVPYLNAGEQFAFRVYSDGAPQEMTVNCRLPDVSVSVQRELNIVRRQKIIDEVLSALKGY